MKNPFEVIEARLINIECLLLDLKHNPKDQGNQPTDRWFSLDDLCQYMPDKPSKATVYGWVCAGIIPVHKGGKKLRFLQSEIDAWMKQGRKSTNAEITADATKYLKQPKK
jgi:excisionase family DNA binding protein